jgi:hypothetical protein
LRRAAFRWSESNWLHWLLLLRADRINVVEGVIDDLAHARVPNIPAEMGIRSELQFNKRGLAKKAAVMAGVAALTIRLIGDAATGRERAHEYRNDTAEHRENRWPANPSDDGGAPDHAPRDDPGLRRGLLHRRRTGSFSYGPYICA